MFKCFVTMLLVVFSFNVNSVNINKLDLAMTNKALFVQQKELPMVNVLLTFNAGSIYEGRYPYGISNLLSNMMSQGTKTSTAEQLSQRLDALASKINIYSNRTNVSIEVISISENLEETLKILEEILISANFPYEELDVVKSSAKQAIKQQKENPSYIAIYNAKKQYYGKKNKKYYISSMGTLKSLDLIDQDVLISYFNENITSENMNVSVVGDISEEKITSLLNKYLSSMRKGTRNVLVNPALKLDAHRMKVEKDLPQTTMVVYGPSVELLSEDYYKSIIFNYVLGGGGFNSRLMEELREKRGLTYGVSSSFEYYLPYDGMFMIQLQTENKNAEKAYSLIKKELRKIGAKGITKEELKSAKEFLVGSYPLKIRTSGKLLSYLDIVQRFDVSPEQLNKWVDGIENTTLEQVNDFASKFVEDEADFARIFVGR